METSAVVTADRRDLGPILAAAVIQGWVLYALHLSIRNQHWPANDPGWLVAFYALALLLPLSFQLLLAHRQAPLTWCLLGTFSIALFYFGWHHGVAVTEFDAQGRADLEGAVPLIPQLALLWLHLLPFAQCRLASGQWRPHYRQVFTFAWRNILTLGEAGIFTGLFWALLFLWQGLFNMLGIGFFKELFSEPVFIYPVTSITFGVALYLIGSLGRWTEVVLEQILSVLKWLAVVAGLILVLFTAALLLKLPTLLFTGERAIGAAWLLWLVAVVVLLINAAFRDGTLERPYPRWIGVALRACMPLLIVIAATAAYSLYVRAAHYGLTVSRIWACVVATVAIAYAAGYSVAATGKGRWMGKIESVNIAVALGLITVMALLLTPILSPYRLSANSQYRHAQTWQPDTADHTGRSNDSPLHYLRFDAGRYGRDRLADLAASDNEPLKNRALSMQKAETRWSARDLPDPQWLDSLVVYPAGRSIDPVLAAQLRNELTDSSSAIRTHLVSTSGSTAGLLIDLNADGADEFILFADISGLVYQRSNEQWKHVGSVTTQDYTAKATDLLSALSAGHYGTEAIVWRELKLGDYRFRYSPPSRSPGNMEIFD